jgi:arylsulfatase A-like enzyme/Flp pilus assembly protein TadD
LILLALAISACRKTSPNRGSRPDIVLVTIDTLRSDALGFSGNRRVATPNLDRIAREGAVFENAHAQNVVTLPSHVNILTGLYPYQHGVRDNDGFHLSAGVPTLATRLKAAGYATAAFIGAFPLDSRYGLARGFDVYDQSFPQGTGVYDLSVPERPAAEVLALARRWLSTPSAGGSSPPRFLWVHLYDCHAPYRPPPPFDRQYAADPYFGEVAGVDAALGSFFDDVRSVAQNRPVLLVVTGDHGEALGDHGELTHGLFAYEATLHIPLLLWSPGRISPRRDGEAVRHVDIAPTVLEAAGLKPAPELPGRSLLSKSKAHSTTSSYFEALSCSFNRGWAPLRGVVDAGFKFVQLPIPELYDLRNDPAEAHNLFEKRPDIARRLASLVPAERSAPKPTTPSSEEAARLRALGYLTGSAPKAGSTPQDDPKALVGLDSDLHRIVDLYERNQLPEAAALGRKIVARRSSMQTGYEFLSLVLTQEGDEPGAIATLEEGRKRGVLSEDLLAHLGLLYAEGGQARRARSLLEPYSRSENVEILNALGIARTGDGDLSGALTSFRRALERDPRNALAYQNMGIAQLQFGKYAEALASFERALALNDHLPRAWNARGVALEKSGRPKEAMEAWKRASDLDPHQVDALYNLALVSGQQGDYATARQALERFTSVAPADRYGAEIRHAREILSRMEGRP